MAPKCVKNIPIPVSILYNLAVGFLIQNLYIICTCQNVKSSVTLSETGASFSVEFMRTILTKMEVGSYI